MASPLTMYVQIKQDAVSQTLAEQAVANFTKGVQAGLDKTGIVHYATLALVPNPSTTPGTPAEGYMGLLLMTDFDLAMNPYLEVFWNAGGGIKEAIQGIAAIAYNPVPTIDTLVQFQNFINSVNLTPDTGNWTNFYQAYNFTVSQINAD